MSVRAIGERPASWMGADAMCGCRPAGTRSAADAATAAAATSGSVGTVTAGSVLPRGKKAGICWNIVP